MKNTHIFVTYAVCIFSLFLSDIATAQTYYNNSALLRGVNDPPVSNGITIASFDAPNMSGDRGLLVCRHTSGYPLVGFSITDYHSSYGYPTDATCKYEATDGAPTECFSPMTVGPNGYCQTPEQIPDSIDECTDAIMTGGGNGSLSVDPSGNVSCSIGEPPSGSCTGTFADEACFSTPTGENGDQCSGGNAYGTINGNPVCVGSGAVQETGSSDSSTWGESTGDAQIISEETTVTQGTNGAGQSVTTTTTTSTTATQVTDTQPDQTAAPYICEDGRPAADRPSCDSSVTCDPGYYLVYGSCVPLPTQSTTETVEQTQSTTTTTNNDTGEETTETSNSNTTKPGTGLAKVEVEGLDGPCNPSEPGYLDCVAGEPQPMPDHTDNGGKTLEEGFQEVYTRMLDSPVATAMRSVAEIVPDGPGNCAPLSMDLSNTPIGTNVSTTVHCDIAESMRGVLQAVMLTFYTIIGFRIFASA